ncbi:hypothetical protein C3486_08605 [Streptomyces sp. Ru73]|uniref:hypothetical protein n=1 Tax=Streptomyces sp. Ru73 TaxID=2080748 RepID=UPI000CDE2A3B|nr:hypothetical protein [Streptomyces sp. Ru73]POX41511.1 hypothetical protein C3486_08605 [Streptomyces sp. Ru73]
MQTHARTRTTATTAAVPRRHHVALSTGVPVVGGIAYGIYAGLLDHSTGSSSIHAFVLGLIAMAVTVVLGLALMHAQDRMITEVRALAYGALFGASMGFLYNLAATSTALKATGYGALFGAIMFVVSLYLFRTHPAPGARR